MGLKEKYDAQVIPNVRSDAHILGIKRYSGFMYHLKKDYMFYLMILPGILYFIIFKYLPMLGIIIAFQDYKPYWGIKGILSAKFVGIKWFRRFFNSIYAGRLISNTLIINFHKLVWGFPAPIILALMLNEIIHNKFKKAIQTISYIPHFLSWVIVSGLLQQLVTVDGGFVNEVIKLFGGEPILFLGSTKYFRSLLVISDIWRGIGWGSIVYLAAISGIEQELYESAKIDGASTIQKMWHITIPSILPIISIMLILRIGDLMDANFQQIMLLLNSQVYSVGDVIDTYVYREGILNMNYSYSMAVSLFKSIVGLVLVLFSNWSAKRMGQEGIW